jgi:lipopolysaccharide/colanic/teichoic acid biosynthesis glycosyltransferase
MSAESQHKLTILYIGITPELLQVFTSRSDLFTLIVEEHGLNAINRLKTEKSVDAIVSEVVLTGMDGFDIVYMLRNQNMHISTPFILVNPLINPEIKKKAFVKRIDDYYDGLIEAENLHNRVVFLNKFKKDLAILQPTQPKIREYRIPRDKRLFDIIVSFTALLFLSPIIVIAMIAIRLESKGKVYYTSKRVGTGYRIFDFYKLRSMRTGADAMLKDLKHLNQYEAEVQQDDFAEPCPRCAELPDGQLCSPVLFAEGKKVCEFWYNESKKSKASSTFIKIQDDPRVTKVGKFIRNTSIDELPQLINVLKGDMSIVGNRPLPLYEAELLTSDDWSERFMGPAGITGLWQVEKRGKGGKMSEEERKALDNQYARSYSFIGDIKLILRTIPAVFQKDNV